MVIQTQHTRQTIRVGKHIGSLLQPGDVIALVGELGTGKTHFIKGLAAGVGVKNPATVLSPSFTFVHEHPGKIPFYHMDLFRLNSEGEAQELGLEEYFGGAGITAVEWADRIPSLLPKELLWIHIHYTGEHHRSIEIIPKGNRYEEILNQIEMRSAEGGVS